jgi:hypothetical protein
MGYAIIKIRPHDKTNIKNRAEADNGMATQGS